MNSQHAPQYDIDVIIPAHNAGAYIEETLESVLSQSVLPKLIVVINDRSTDDTEAIVRKISTDSPVPIMLIQSTGKGPAAARNTGLKASSSEFIAFLDADDLWKPTKLESQLGIFQKNPNAGFVYCGFEYCDEIGEAIPTSLSHIHPTRGNDPKVFLSDNSIVPTPGVLLVRRSALEAVGWFDESLIYTEDWDLLIRLGLRFPFDYVDENLVLIRKHPKNSSKSYYAMYYNILLLMKKWHSQLTVTGKRNMGTYGHGRLVLGLLSMIKPSEPVSSGVSTSPLKNVRRRGRLTAAYRTFKPYLPISALNAFSLFLLRHGILPKPAANK